MLTPLFETFFKRSTYIVYLKRVIDLSGSDESCDKIKRVKNIENLGEAGYS